jgi:hypothetical protein
MDTTLAPISHTYVMQGSLMNNILLPESQPDNMEIFWEMV